MKHKDKRMNMTSECIQHIKMLKLYAWTHKFFEKIAEVRRKELRSLWHAFIIISFLLISLYTFPMLVRATLFAVYIGSGHNIDL